MTEHAVVIAGGGPTGMMLAGELTLAGLDVTVVERRVDKELDGSRAGGLHSRTIEVLDQRGIAERFLAEGKAVQVQAFAMIPLDISDFPTRHNYGLALWQKHFERILGGWIEELGVRVERGREVTGFVADDEGVDVTVDDGRTIRGAYLVGCDGGRSVVRKAAGIDFPGWDPSVSALIAEVEMTEEPAFGLQRDAAGTYGMGPMDDGRRIRVLVRDNRDDQSGEPSLDDLRRALVAVWGTDFGVHSPTWISRFTDMTRQAASYRSGRVLLAGDAAHVHYPVGGQGLHVGVQDAVNLGWKLAQVVKGISPAQLLDTYQAERHPVAARVLENTMAQTALTRAEPRVDALRDAVAELLGMDEPRKRFAGMISGLDVHYDLGPGHPLVGWRMPDLDLYTADGPTRVFELLRDVRPLLLDLTGAGVDITGWSDRVRLVQARSDGEWALPVVGEIPAPPAALVRPDGHVAWAGELSDPALPEALETWFGAARAA
jgi:2-polyprenyl-6-methoxyphenol hydroxylase-like FAD-dependent oxidoreductase